MEQTTEVEPQRRRGRKRKRENVHNAMVDDGKKKAVETRSLKLVGRYVQKEFKGSGVFLGRVMLYDSGLYRVNYEDGDCEDLDSGEVKACLVEDNDLTGEWSEKKEKLDELLLTKEVDAKVLKGDSSRESENANPFDSSLLSKKTNDEAGAVEVHDAGNSDVDADSSSDSCEDSREGDVNMDMEVALVPAPELPPSSGHIGVPEEYVSHLLSVYSFLRSFSVSLFLHPFGLNDFVGAINCSVANTLLDSVHVALMRVLKCHFEKLSSDGSDLASKCLRSLDWSLLDTLTWPIYLVHYLVVMGYTNRLDWKGFYTQSLERDYYTLSAGNKLIVLQILCEDVLDSEELRTEMDMREESEVGIDVDMSTMEATTCEPRKVHSRYYKSSAHKNIAGKEIVAGHHDIKSSMVSQIGGPVGNSIDDDDDNGDECRLCGMDGLLVCCDGCPSSYHSRCVGLNKLSMPTGSWYCPECKINAAEPEILRGTTLRGGENFGSDPYEQVFVASCDHLLVLKASINSEVCIRYYNRNDIPGVLQALNSKAEHVFMYSEICWGIMQYWELPKDILPCNKMSEIGLQLANKEGNGQCITQSVNLVEKSAPEMSEVENPESCVTGISPDMPDSYLTNCVQQPVLSGNSLDTLAKSDWQMDSARQKTGIIKKSAMSEPASSSSLVGLPAKPCELNQNTPCVSETVSNVTSNINVKYNGPTNDISLEAKSSRPAQKLNDKVDRKACGSTNAGCLYIGSSFKTTGYINYYLHGDFAASAAAKLAILSSEENQVRESRSDNRQKVLSASATLQLKAFSLAATRFFWPNTEKKLVEVRERCSWCFSCKASVSSKRGCLLNAAASNAMRGATKVLAGVRPVRNGDGRLSGIASYILFMEESLSGLVVGPFLNDTFREQWRKQVEQATTCSAIKFLLLELEENIHTIALSGDWMKLVEGSTKYSTSQIAASAAGSTQKRKPGRRGRKPSAMVEVALDDDQEKKTDFTWWRGGTLSKLMLGRGILPCATIRKSARQGGAKKIPGIHYLDGNETPRCSRQLVWRSAVEMARNTAQLALQVRYLDFHVRWGDLVRPEQTLSDGKGPETEASAFRNASICDKKILRHETRYCVAFGIQKHLPSRVMKNITDIEQLNDGNERYWFSQTYIPLYLIREFEQKVEKNKPVNVLSKLRRKQLKASRRSIFSSLLWKQDMMVRSSCCSCHKDLFYRSAVKCSSCQGFCHEQCATSSTVNMGEEVEFLTNCKQCIKTQAATRIESSYGSPTSHLCLQGQDFPNPATSAKRLKIVSSKGPSVSNGTLERSSEVKSTKRSSASNGTLEHSSELKSAKRPSAAKSTKKLQWGLIWRKKDEDTGIDFRLKNILLRGNPNGNLGKPVCRLCNQPYNADLMYICCETCNHWFHADAVELDESKIFSLVGFKCSKCRRIRSPVCPYLDPEKKKVLEKRQQAAKSDIPPVDFNSGKNSSHQKEAGPTYSALPRKPEVNHLSPDDPLLVSISKVEQCTEDMSKVDYSWNNATASGPGPRKLPVRRHIKQEKDVLHQAGSFQFEVSAPFEQNVFKSTEKLPVRRHIKRETDSECYSATKAEVSDPSERNVVNLVQDSLSPQLQSVASKENFDDGIISLDYDGLGYDDVDMDMEFEPQTYFSFNELLASDDGANANGNESQENAVENWEGPENGTLEISYDQEEPIISLETTIDVVPCKSCSNTEPCPELYCQICGIWIHKYCSPWIESSPWEDGWRCGNCREWR